MLTLFTTAKPFRGHIGVIQRNALQSWQRLDPAVEVIVFGDDEGAAEVCADLRLRHEPHTERNDSGLKRVDYLFDRAQELARHETLCYVNCDIILMQDFLRAVTQVQAAHPQFLMIGRRWDTDITHPVDFSAGDWESEVVRKAAVANHRQTEWFIDYFAFPRGLYHGKIPPLVIGRIYWDNWLIGCARGAGVPVVDASAVVRAIHQNHNYAYHLEGKSGVWKDEQSSRNFQVAGGWRHLGNIADATELLDAGRVKPGGVGAYALRPNRKRHWAAAKRIALPVQCFLIYKIWLPVWHFFLDITRPVRSVLGLRSRSAGSRGKV